MRAYARIAGESRVGDVGLVGDSLSSNVSSGNYAAIQIDYDNDGHGDMYLSKCRLGVTDPTDRRRINRLFRNDGTNSYSDEGSAAGLDDGEQSWCADFADIDNDGDLDCFVLNHGPGASKLFENDGSGSFTDISASAGLADIDYFGIQALFRDFDNDTFVDLLVTTSNLGGSEATYRLYRNNGDSTFTDVTATAFVVTEPFGPALGVSTADFDDDGWLDIATSTWDTAGTLRLYHNNGDGILLGKLFWFIGRARVLALLGLLVGANSHYPDAAAAPSANALRKLRTRREIVGLSNF